MTRRRLMVVGLACALFAVSDAFGAVPPPFVRMWSATAPPQSIAVGPDGSIYVGREAFVEKRSADGTFLFRWGGDSVTLGHFPGAIYGVATDATGNVYVADHDANRVQKFDSSGQFISYWGTGGSGNGAFSLPLGIAVDADGYVYVVDSHNYRIQKFTAQGAFVLKWGSNGSGEGQFAAPWGITVDSHGFVYVTDRAGDGARIKKFDSEGHQVAAWGSVGVGDGLFSLATGIAVDFAGIVYVTDPGNNEIQEFTDGGKFLARWGSPGTGEGQFNFPRDIAVGAASLS